MLKMRQTLYIYKLYKLFFYIFIIIMNYIHDIISFIKTMNIIHFKCEFIYLFGSFLYK